MNSFLKGFLVFLTVCVVCSCTGNKSYDTIQGEWKVEGTIDGQSVGNQVIRIDETYFQELTKLGDDSISWASVTHIYKLSNDTITTSDINHKIKKLYAWNAFVIKSRDPEKMQLKTLSGDILTLKRIYSDFEKVDPSLDSVLASKK